MSDIGVTTKKHFEVFKKEVMKWVKAYSLLDWNITIEHIELADNGNSAECAYNIIGKSATIRLNKYFTDTEHFTTQEIKEAAAHEVFELLLCHFGHLAECRYTTDKEIEIARHGIIARLINYHFHKP